MSRLYSRFTNRSRTDTSHVRSTRCRK